MGDISTVKLDELFRTLPENSGLDPRLVEEAKTEVDVLKFRAGASLQTHKQKTWSKSDIDKLQESIQDRDTEILLLKRQLQDRSRSSRGVGGEGDVVKVTKIKDDYNQLYRVEWVESFNFFKLQGWNDIEIILFLQRILRASYAFCKDVAKEQLQNIEGEGLHPMSTWMDDDAIISRLQQRQITREISQLAKLYQRTTAQDCLPALENTFVKYVLPTFIDKSTDSYEELKSYSNKCIEITWAMCLQEPPVIFVDKLERGADFDTDRFRKYTTNGNKFDYLVWPAMLLQQGGAMMCKGVAQPIKSSDRESAASSRTPESRSVRTRPDDVTDAQSEHNSWEKIDSRANTRANTRTNTRTNTRANTANSVELPPKVYKWAPEHDGTVPRTPYFDPYSPKTPQPASKPPSRASRHESRDGGRFSRPLTEVNDEDIKEGNLTVLWQNKKNDRTPSAP